MERLTEGDLACAHTDSALAADAFLSGTGVARCSVGSAIVDVCLSIGAGPAASDLAGIFAGDAASRKVVGSFSFAGRVTGPAVERITLGVDARAVAEFGSAHTHTHTHTRTHTHTNTHTHTHTYTPVADDQSMDPSG